MSEDTKIETKPQSYRLPVDVIETLGRWATETGQSVTACITNCVRVAAEDEKRITNGVEAGESVLQDGEMAVGVIQVRLPKSRDELADAFTGLIVEVGDWIGERDQISALGVARARIYKGSVEYQAAESMRAAAGMPSIYEDEKALADKLSRDGGAGQISGAREKGDKSR